MKAFIAILVGMLTLGASAASTAAEGATADSHGVLEPMPRALEVRFALSALPSTLRGGATVYVLDPSKGYTRERSGTNGQSCFVSRTEWKFADYRNDIFDATCYDATGAKYHMPVLFDVAALRARGVAATEMKKQIEAGFRTGRYRAPDSAGLSYMTAPLMRTYMSLDPNDKSTVMTMSMPHVMYYRPTWPTPRWVVRVVPRARRTHSSSSRVRTAISFSASAVRRPRRSSAMRLTWSEICVRIATCCACASTVKCPDALRPDHGNVWGIEKGGPSDRGAALRRFPGPEEDDTSRTRRDKLTRS